ncbi:MAG: enoyl-CoA hydratase/isomerase family protein [Chloroflexi bacterium]|nr:enoyl-CoA hydratase/isomerase family protein [Chloroflexota bacterium]
MSEVSGQRVLSERRAGIAVVTINRPEIGNAVDQATTAALGRVVAELATDESLRAVVLTGAGDRAFVTGGDLKQYLAAIRTAADARRMSLGMQAVLERLANLDVPVIAAINGAAYGGGCEVALACDYRIASARAEFGFRQVKMGIMVGWGGGQRLLRVVGRSKALALLLTGETVSAAEALALGLVDRVVSPEDVLPAAFELAAQIAENPPLAVRFTKRALVHGAEAPAAVAAAYEAELLAALWVTEDHREAERAFVEKRAPVFVGR